MLKTSEDRVSDVRYGTLLTVRHRLACTVETVHNTLFLLVVVWWSVDTSLSSILGAAPTQGEAETHQCTPQPLPRSVDSR